MKKLLILGIVLSALPAFAQAPQALLPPIVSCFYNANGAPYAGGFIYSYAAFSSTPQVTYADSTGTVANTNPVTLDSAGCATVWLGPLAYDIELRDSNNATVRRTNNVTDVAQILYSKVVLINPVGSALQTVIGPVGASWFVGTTLKHTSPGVRIGLLDPITTIDTATNTPTVTTTNPAVAGQNYQIPDPGVAQSHFVLSAGNTANTLDCSQAPLTCIRKAFFYFESAGCNNTTPALGWDTFGSNSPTPFCVTGTNTQKGVMGFPAAINFQQQNTGTAAAATTVTTTYPATTVVGDLLIAEVVVDTSRTVSGCTDGTNAYTKAAGVVNGTLDTEVWYFNGSSASKTAGTTLTCTFSAAGNGAVSWQEYSGNSVTGGAIIGLTATNSATGTAVTTGNTAAVDGSALILSTYGSVAGGSPTAIGAGGTVLHTVARQSTNVQVQSQGVILPHLGLSNPQSGAFTLSSSQAWGAVVVTVLPLVATPVDITAQRTVLLPPSFTTTGSDFIVTVSTQYPTTTQPVPVQSIQTGAIWGVSVACTAPGSTDDPAFQATSSTLTSSSAATANIVANGTIGPLAIASVGCTAGNLLHFRVHRVRNSTFDGYEGYGYLTGVSLQFAVNQ